MKMKELNQKPENWLKCAKGFFEGFILVFNEWDLWFRRGFNHEQVQLLLYPQQHLFVHTVELYLKAFLIYKKINPNEVEKMGHDLKTLREECSNFDVFFEQEEIKYIDFCAGSTRNYIGKKYPEGGTSSSFHDLLILRKIDSHVTICIKLQ